MRILEDELVRKYFGVWFCPGHDSIHGTAYHSMDSHCQLNEDKTALAILEAREAPIKKGEKCLEFGGSMEQYFIRDSEAPNDFNQHPAWLRLPDAFQGDPVEEKIKKLVESYGPGRAYAILEESLRYLVRLARQGE
jgi:hypothetical protein